MPSYDFKCPTCQQTISIHAGIKEDLPTPICFRCKGEMTRVYGIGAVTFSGSGFYSTDR